VQTKFTLLLPGPNLFLSAQPLHAIHWRVDTLHENVVCDDPTPTNQTNRALAKPIIFVKTIGPFDFQTKKKTQELIYYNFI